MNIYCHYTPIQTLAVLELTSNRISDGGIESIADALKNNQATIRLCILKRITYILIIRYFRH